MEADWDELSRIAMPPPSAHALPTVATTIAFDDVMELLWTGNEYVSIRIESWHRLDKGLTRVFSLIRVESLRSMDPTSNDIPLCEPIRSPREWCAKFSFTNAA
jgi:hypothetical protein